MFIIKLSLVVSLIIPVYYALSHMGEVSSEQIVLTTNKLPLASEVYDRHGKKIGEFAKQRRYFAPISSMPTILIEAFLSAEDKNYFTHRGIDYLSIFRALFANLSSLKIKQGGSTITQQLARLMFLNREKTWLRKNKEAQIAQILEKKYTKKKILEYYLNTIYLGNGAYGVESASRSYFRKSVSALTLAESALLAGLPKAPSMLAPHRHYEAAKKRQQFVLQRLRADKIISDEQYVHTVAKQVKVYQHAETHTAPYFNDQVRKILHQRFSLNDLHSKGYQIYTSLDSALQQKLNRSLQKRAASINAEMQAAAVVLHAKSGEVLALQGGLQYSTTQFNRALSTQRQSHNLLLPFVLAEIAEAYSYSLQEIDPLFRKFYKSVLQQRTSNIDELLQEVGVGSMQKVFQALSVSFEQQQLKFSLMQMVSAFAVFANAGMQHQPRYITRITTHAGKQLFQVKQSSGKRLFSARSAFIVGEVLRAYLRQQGEDNDLSGYACVNRAQHDSWYVGYDAERVYGIWAGAERGQLRVTENLAFNLFKHAFKNFRHEQQQDIPQDIAYVSVKVVEEQDIYLSLPVPL